MKKLIILLIAVAVIVSTIFVGASCQSAKEEETAKASEEETEVTGSIELNIWWWSEPTVPGSKAFLLDSIEAYKEIHPEITIKETEQTSDNLYPAFRAAAEAKKGPDIQFLFSAFWLLEDVWMGNVAPISDYVPASETDHWLLQDGYTYDNKLWASPWYKEVTVMIYNKSLFAEAGLDVDNPPETWEDFLVASQKLKDAGIIPFGFGVKDPWAASWLDALYWHEEFDSMDQLKKMCLEENGFSDQKMKVFFDRISELKEKGYFNDTIMSLDFSQARDEFLNKKAAMSLAAYGDLKSIVESMGSDVQPMKTPIYGNGALSGTINTQPQVFSIAEFSNHKQEAADFLVFLHTKERLKKYHEMTNALPADDRFDPAWITRDFSKFVYDYAKESPGPWIDIFMPTVIASEGLYPAIQNIISGSMNTDQAIKLMNETSVKWREMNPEQVENFKKWYE